MNNVQLETYRVVFLIRILYYHSLPVCDANVVDWQLPEVLNSQLN